MNTYITHTNLVAAFKTMTCFVIIGCLISLTIMVNHNIKMQNDITYNFQNMKQTYTTIVKQVLTSHENKLHKGVFHYNGTKYMIYPYSPVFIAFPLEGRLDHWTGIIYDDTGLLNEFIRNKINHINDEKINKKSKNIFGGIMIDIKKLDANFFWCRFT